MQIRAETASLRLAETFTIARGSSDVEEVVQVALEHEGVTGYGEGAPVDYWGETTASLAAFVETEAAALVGADPFALEAIGDRLREVVGQQGAKMALDGALHDWLGKRLGQPVWRLLGLTPQIPATSFTLGIDTVEATAAKARRSWQYQVLKIKVGGPGDLERLEAVRAASDARIRIDGNEGWTFDTAREMLPHLLRLGVEYVEEPFPAADIDSYMRYRELPERLPVYIDEGCKDSRSIPRIATYAEGINIKLAKAGGIREALRMVHVARAHGLGVMIGCMIESQLGISQSCQVAPLVDHVDLDGHLLIADQPWVGLGFSQGCIQLSGAPGLGVRPAAPTEEGA